ncbi:TetR family transcriptional regulator [Actinomycetes bacterium KLBMP 9797]
MAQDRVPLRERKKLRTREALIDTALTLFSERGFAHTTLDELCDAVEVSKRTFFRTFTSKEDVTMAPIQDMWAAFLDELRVREPAGRTVLAMLQDALLAAVDRMTADDWAARVLLSRQLATRTPSMNAHGLDFCDRTIRAALTVLHERLDVADADDVRLRLALDILVAAFHRALETWAGRSGTPDRADLVAELWVAFRAVPDSLTLTAARRAA